MGNYDHHSSPALTPPRTRCLRLISLVLLLTFASYSSLPVSSDLLENALDWVRWKTTRLPSDPLARAYALLKWSPVIGEVLRASKGTEELSALGRYAYRPSYPRTGYVTPLP